MNCLLLQVSSDDSAFKEPYALNSNGLDGEEGPTVVRFFCFFYMFIALLSGVDHNWLISLKLKLFSCINTRPHAMFLQKLFFFQQEGLSATKPMPIPTIDTSRSQVIDM